MKCSFLSGVNQKECEGDATDRGGPQLLELPVKLKQKNELVDATEMKLIEYNIIYYNTTTVRNLINMPLL